MTLDELLNTPTRIFNVAFAACCDHPTSLDTACAAALEAVRNGKATKPSDDFIIELVGRIQAQIESDKHPVKTDDMLNSFRMFGFSLGDTLGKQLGPLVKLHEHLGLLARKRAKG